MRTIRPSLLVLGLLVPISAPIVVACSGSDRCVIIVDQQIACAPAEQRSRLTEARERTLATCREQAGSDPVADQEAQGCAEKRSCDEVRRCSNAIKDRSYAREVIGEIEAALATGERREEALSTCHFTELKDEGVKQRCGQLFAQVLATATGELESIRDQGGAPEGRCFDLGMTAKRVSPDAKARAEALCKEVDASARARAAIAEARKNIDSRALAVPFQCGTAALELERIHNDWARARLVEVTRACFVELGASLLPVVVPTMQYTCEFHVGQVFQAVKKYALADPRLDPWIAKAAAKCGDSPAVE